MKATEKSENSSASPTCPNFYHLELNQPPSEMAAANIADNDDLLMEILFRLPARSVVRFKCVSRGWRHIISHNRRFSLLHAQRHPSPPCSGILSSSSDHFHFCWLSPRRSFSPPPPGRSLLRHSTPVILQSCNGLLLCCSNSGFVVFNLTTNQTSQLPPPEKIPASKLKSVSLAFDVSRWNGKLLWTTGIMSDNSMLLDLEKAELQPFNLPCHISRVCYWGESCGHLFLAADAGEEVEVFELEEEGTRVWWLGRFAVDAGMIVRCARETECRRSLRIDDEMYHLSSYILSVGKIEDEDEDWCLICRAPCEKPR